MSLMWSLWLSLVVLSGGLVGEPQQWLRATYRIGDGGSPIWSERTSLMDEEGASLASRSRNRAGYVIWTVLRHMGCSLKQWSSQRLTTSALSARDGHALFHIALLANGSSSGLSHEPCAQSICTWVLTCIVAHSKLRIIVHEERRVPVILGIPKLHFENSHKSCSVFNKLHRPLWVVLQQLQSRTHYVADATCLG